MENCIPLAVAWDRDYRTLYSFSLLIIIYVD